MDTVGTFEAKTHLTRLLERVAAGEQITITRHGTSVARLVPVMPGGAQEIRVCTGQAATLPKVRRGLLSVAKKESEAPWRSSSLRSKSDALTATVNDPRSHV